MDTSFGASVANLNERIGWGVIAANVTEPPGDYQSRIGDIESQLDGVCE